ncbi:MAG: CheY-like protein receiver [uncultured bacterium]|nr:MAG: CheY-like protein receiver [uncultured bacterium]
MDDNPVALQFLENILLSLGVKATSINDPCKGIEIFTENNFDFVFIDIRMPKINGYELVESFARMNPDYNTKFIALSTNIYDDSRNNVLNSGFDAFLLKPVKEMMVASIFAKFIGTFKENDKTLSEPKNFQGVLLRVLLVEDNEVNQKMMTKMTRKMGIKMDIANDGIEAIRMIQEKKYSLIFMDVQMPGMDGYEATRKIRELHINTPIIATTAHAMSGDKDRCLSSGMDYYIPKPIRRHQIYEIVSKFIGKDILKAKVDSYRFLIVEDDSNLLNALADVFKMHFTSSACEAVNDGTKACMLLGSFLPDIVIMDLMMPDMDGIKVIKYLKSDKRYSKVALIVMTGLEENDRKVQEARSFGVNHFIFKPFKFENILEKINVILKDLKDISRINKEGIHLIESNSNELGLDSGEYVEILKTFIKNTENKIDIINNSINNKEKDKLIRLAHSIKGSAANINFLEIANMASNLEKEAFAEEYGKCRLTFEEIVNSIKTIGNILNNYDKKQKQ